MGDAAKARQEGARTRERETYRTAARTYPTSKEPWQKLAESYFESADYGNAILAAQEVLQRDGSDSYATGILAVSGLRVSTSALAALRQQQSLSADTRAQAEEVAKSLRELLGEPVLVPKPAEAAPPPPPRRPARPAAAKPPVAASGAAPASAGGPAAAAPAKPTAMPAAASAAKAAASAAKPASPFDKLK